MGLLSWLFKEKENIRVCFKCDGKDFHPVREFVRTYHWYKCPICGRVWCEEMEDE